MSLWFPRRSTEKRQIELPLFGLSGPRVALQQSSYADIDGSKVDTALQSVAVRSAVDLIASIGSELPVDVFRGTGASRTQLPIPSWLEDPGGDGYGRQDWCYRALMSWLLRGNVYGEALGRRPTHFTQVELFHPDQVSGWMENGEPVWNVNGRHVDRNFVHKRVNPVPGQIQGLSPISYHATTIGVSLSSTAFGHQWFRDGAHPNAMIRNTESPLEGEDQAKTIKQRFMAALRGSREPMVVGKAWEYQAIQVNPEESQFLETQGFSAAECARIFGPGIAEILGYSGSSLTYSNIQDRDIHVLKYSLNKWLRRLERFLSDFLPNPQYVVLNRDALLQTNTLQRYQAHASALDKRWKTVNEIREIEDLSPVSWGNEPNSASSAAPQSTPDDESSTGDEE